jgi:AcrR family transcriptional regulator
MTSARRSYHHGDLRRAILDEGMSIVRESGLDTLAVRDITRRLGVAPNAAYRHYADRGDLLVELAQSVQGILTTRIAAAIQRTERKRNGSRPHARLVAFANAYVLFATSEPAWFDLLCRVRAEPAKSRPSADAPEASPHDLLQATLAELGAAGAIAPERRQDAVWVLWALLDGTAKLATTGPLASWSRHRLAGFVEDAIDVALAGLAT